MCHINYVNWPSLSWCRVDRLSAHDVITVRRLLEYVYSKIELKMGSSEAAKDNEGALVFEMLCQDQVRWKNKVLP